MSQRLFSAILIAVAAVCPAQAADLSFSLGGEVEYDRNVFRRERDREDDFLFRLRPGVRVHEDRGQDVSFSLGYELPVEFAADNNEELQDEDHIVDGRVLYHVNDRLEFFVDDRLRFLRSTLRTERAGSENDVTGTPLLGNERDRVTLNDGSIGALYRFAPRLQGRLVASTTYFDTTRDDRSEVHSVSGTAGADYVLTSKHQIGGGLRYSYQHFSEHSSFAGSQSHTYNGFATWRWLIDETLNLELSAGPSFLQSEQEDADPTRQSARVPFAVLSAGNYTFFDKNGNLQQNAPVSAGSLLVPSYFVNAGGGPTLNCGTVDGVPVVAGCTSNSFNVVLDAVSDAPEVSSLSTVPIAVTNLNPAGRDDQNLTIFASAVVTKRWSPTLASALRYTRDQGNASGLGGTVIEDAVSLATTWDLLERWQLAVRGDWTSRESAFEQRQTFDQVAPLAVSAIPGGSGSGSVLLAARNGSAFNTTQQSEIDTVRWGVGGRITHRLFRSTLVYVQVRYDHQRSEGGTRGRSSDFENLLATVGVRHTFEPIKLW